MANTAVAATNKSLAELKGMAEAKDFQNKLARALGHNTGLDPGRLTQQMLTMVYKSPQLMKCKPISILLGMVQAAELGLELAGPLGQAWLVPRYDWKTKGQVACFQIGYKGYISLAFRSGMVQRFTPEIVYANDEFYREYGLRKDLVHKPANGPRGEPIHYYAVVALVNGGVDFHDMSKEAVQAHRLRYSPPPQDKEDKSAWATNFDAMALKTCCGFIGRRSPVAVELFRAASVDHEQEVMLGVRDEGNEPEPNRTEQLDHKLNEMMADRIEDVAEKEPVVVQGKTVIPEEGEIVPGK